MRVIYGMLCVVFIAIAFPLIAKEEEEMWWLKYYEARTYISPNILGREAEPEEPPIQDSAKPQATESPRTTEKKASEAQASDKQSGEKPEGERRRRPRRRGPIGPAMPYRFLAPETIEPGKTYPLVLYFHGSGSEGDNNIGQMWGGGTPMFVAPENRKKYPCFVVAPQCAKGDTWVELLRRPAKDTIYKMSDKPTISMGRALELLDKLIDELPVDKDRIYTTGVSFGGYAVWDVVQRRPDLFAAAIPICGGGDSALAPKFKNLAVWVFHGENDGAVPVRHAKEMVEALTKAGGTPKMTIYEGAGHNVWDRTYHNAEVIAWLFAQKKKPVTPVLDANCN